MITEKKGLGPLKRTKMRMCFTRRVFFVNKADFNTHRVCTVAQSNCRWHFDFKNVCPRYQPSPYSKITCTLLLVRNVCMSIPASSSFFYCLVALQRDCLPPPGGLVYALNTKLNFDKPIHNTIRNTCYNH